ncbi:MAG: acyl-CoA thioester hydrolase/BAAT C-terminal domain-containing protein [Agriterribacter sp.]
MKSLLTLLIGILSTALAFGQDFKDTLFQHYTLTNQKLKTFELHITKSQSKTKKPLIIYLDGSGNFPIYYKTKSGRYNTSIAMDIKRYAKDYYVAIISKPGTPFQDTLQYSSSGRAYYPENEMYKQLYSLDWRAQTASEAINYLIKVLPIDTRKIIVIGYSEGSQVAPKVAVINNKVTHVVCFVGNALNQLYDFILEVRLKAERKQITTEESQQIVDSLYTEYERIYQNPNATNQFWYGATYLKWSSFSRTTPLENMLKLDIPILYIAGGKDNNQTILDMDYAKLEFLRKGKTNMTYKVFPNANHFFQEEKLTDGTIKKIDRIDEVHQFAIDWINSPTK